jgi:hypothetical protein
VPEGYCLPVGSDQSSAMRKRLFTLIWFFGFSSLVLLGGLAKASWLAPMPMHRTERVVCDCVKPHPDTVAADKAYVEEAMHAAVLPPRQNRK